MQIRRGVVASLGLAAVTCVASATPSRSEAASTQDGNPVHILAYEPFRPLTSTPSSTSRKTNSGTLTRLQFDAYGRRFSLELEKNTRLTRSVDLTHSTGPALSLYQGVIENLPGSWVRLSAKAQDIRGMIWDGRELYVVERAEAVRDSIPTQQKSGGSGSVIFRLSDTEIEPGASFCGEDQAKPVRNGKAAYSQLLNELKGSPVIMQAAGASVRLEISALGDSLFRQRYASSEQARDEILSRLNNVDGIFSSQLGVEIQVP